MRASKWHHHAMPTWLRREASAIISATAAHLTLNIVTQMLPQCLGFKDLGCLMCDEQYLGTSETSFGITVCRFDSVFKKIFFFSSSICLNPIRASQHGYISHTAEKIRFFSSDRDAAFLSDDA